jgi:hypothetical protein
MKLSDRDERDRLTCNNGFWDRPAEERGEKMDAACRRAGVSSFYDLSPEERSRVYEQD